MEPTYHSGDRVFVEEINPSTMLPGTIGAFQYDNSTYIKEYTENGLLSHNPKYKLMEFDENTEVLLIGKVIGTLSAEDIPTAEEIEMFRSLRND